MNFQKTSLALLLALPLAAVAADSPPSTSIKVLPAVNDVQQANASRIIPVDAAYTAFRPRLPEVNIQAEMPSPNAPYQAIPYQVDGIQYTLTDEDLAWMTDKEKQHYLEKAASGTPEGPLDYVRKKETLEGGYVAFDLKKHKPADKDKSYPLISEEMLQRINNFKLVSPGHPFLYNEIDKIKAFHISKGHRYLLRQIANLPTIRISNKIALTQTLMDYSIILRKDVREFSRLGFKKISSEQWLVTNLDKHEFYYLEDKEVKLAKLFESIKQDAPLRPYSEEMEEIPIDPDEFAAVFKKISGLRPEKMRNNISRTRSIIREKRLYYRMIEPYYKDIRYCWNGELFSLTQEDLLLMEKKKQEEYEFIEEVTQCLGPVNYIELKEKIENNNYLDGNNISIKEYQSTHEKNTKNALIPASILRRINNFEVSISSFLKPNGSWDKSKHTVISLPHFFAYDLFYIKGTTKNNKHWNLLQSIANFPVVPIKEKISLTKTKIDYGLTLLKDDHFITALAFVKKSENNYLIINITEGKSYFFEDKNSILKNFFITMFDHKGG